MRRRAPGYLAAGLAVVVAVILTGCTAADRESAAPTAPAPAARSVDWRNAAYTTACGDNAPEPFRVEVRNGSATVPSTSASDYDEYRVTIEAVVTGAGETAVLLACSPQPSNFDVQEIQVFEPDGRLRGALPDPRTVQEGTRLPPEYVPSEISIADGAVVTGMRYYQPGDSRASGPSEKRTLVWTWNGTAFVQRE